MKMPKSKAPTFKEVREGIEVSKEWREYFAESMKRISPLIKTVIENADAWKAEAAALYEALHEADIHQAEKYIAKHPPSAGAIAFLILVTQDKFKSENAAMMANLRHSKPGGSRDKAQQMRELWASGKYTAKDICAEQECSALGMSFSSARKALVNLPKPT